MTGRPLALAVLAAAAAAPPAAAQAPPPTLQFAAPCFTAEQPLAFTGTGYTPDGPVTMLFASPAGPRGGFDVAADAGGRIADSASTREDTLLGDSEDRATIIATATDRTRADAGAQPPESQFAAAQFEFTRWAGFSPGRYAPGRKVRLEAYGWAFATGKTLWFQFRRGRVLARSVRVGRLAGPCGDVAKRVRVPRGLEAGRYRLVLSTEKRALSTRYTWRSGRVTRRAGAASAERVMRPGRLLR